MGKDNVGSFGIGVDPLLPAGKSKLGKEGNEGKLGNSSEGRLGVGKGKDKVGTFGIGI
jgi:hypothetical protein